MYKASGIQSMPLNTVRVIWRAAGAAIGSLHVWALETAGANVAGYRAVYVFGVGAMGLSRIKGSKQTGMASLHRMGD